MQTRKTIEIDVKTILQTVLNTMKSLGHAGNVAYPKPGKVRLNTKESGYNVKI